MPVTTETKIRKKPTPRKAESITAGALNLSIEEMILLRDQLSDSIQAGLEDRKIKLDQGRADFEKLSKLVNGIDK